jgi:hypothetical protein
MSVKTALKVSKNKETILRINVRDNPAVQNYQGVKSMMRGIFARKYKEDEAKALPKIEVFCE